MAPTTRTLWLTGAMIVSFVRKQKVTGTQYACVYKDSKLFAQHDGTRGPGVLRAKTIASLSLRTLQTLLAVS